METYVQRKSFSLLPLLAVGLVWIVSGCRPEVQPMGSARLVGRVDQTLISTGVARVSVTLSAPDLDARTVELVRTEGEWGGTMENIPAGDSRTFSAEAFSLDGTKVFAGQATGVTIQAGQTALVAITLQQLSPPPPFENAVPVIDSLVASASAVVPGGTVTLSATAHDPNTGDSLTYAWTAPAGTFGSASSATTAWTAPAATGPVPLMLTVTDPHGASAAMTVTLSVRTSAGGADIDVSLNTWPQVARITASPSRVNPGEPTTVVVSASDVDGDTLSYQWSASGCTGTWADEHSASARFTPDAVPAGGACDCRLGVTVADGRGGQGQGTLSICVGESPAPSFPPELVAASRSSDTATPGGTLTLRVEARDPQGSALGFTWVANTGTLGAPVTGASVSEVSWTAPACLTSGTPTVAVTVRNALGLSTPYTFTIPGLADCSPPHDSWSAIGGLHWGRQRHTATVLSSGRVLVVGGVIGGYYTESSVEEYDPVTGLSLGVASLHSERVGHTATLLPSGQVLVVGGYTTAGGALASAELYDPASRTWTLTGSLSVARSYHTATVLPSGRVLVVGGYTVESGALASAELYDPASGTWSPVASASMSHSDHTATLLPSGKVLVAGGGNAVAELYDPAAGTWTLTGALGSRRTVHAAILLRSGRVLVMGGTAGTGAELYDPASGTWSPTGDMAAPHFPTVAVMLVSGKVLVAGGGVGYGSDETELYDPGSGTWTALGRLANVRQGHAMVRVPSGKAVLLGGDMGACFAEVFDPATAAWSAQGASRDRTAFTLTPLPSGKLLAAGGYVRFDTGGIDTAAVYDPETRSWSPTASLLGARYGHTATLLSSGKVLVAGGTLTRPDSLQTAELYDPESGTWSAAAPMGFPRAGHTATLLPSGKVLVVGGWNGAGAEPLRSAELYDPATDTWSPTGAPLAVHAGHTATLLPSGQVLVVGSEGGEAYTRTAELYDPASGTWSWTGAPEGSHVDHTATLLPSGKVLVVGGTSEDRVVELYDPASGTWSPTGNLRSTRLGHTATLLPSGQVLVVGGRSVELMTFEEVRADLYDPETGTWTSRKDSGTPRMYHRAALLPSGQVLVVGGAYASYALGMLYTP
jgi:hypothetical protein